MSNRDSIKPTPSKQDFFSYPGTPKQYVEDCISGLRSCMDQLPTDSIQCMILRRVIKDIEFTSGKIC